MKAHHLIAWCAIATGASHAQYREGEPPTISPTAAPTPVDDEGSIVRTFREAYVRAGSPRIVVSWNKPFDDTLADATIKQQSTQSSSRNESTKLEDTTKGDAGSSKLTDEKGSRSSESTTREGSFVANAGARLGPAEKGVWIIEAEFDGVLAKAGVSLIDRAAIMRATSSQTGGMDSRAIEAAAFAGKADLLLEILLTEDQRGPSGWLYRVRLLNVKTGERLGETVTYAEPQRPAESARYQATDKGFVRVTSKRTVSLNEVAHQLGLDVLKQMSARLNQTSAGGRTK